MAGNWKDGNAVLPQFTDSLHSRVDRSVGAPGNPSGESLSYSVAETSETTGGPADERCRNLLEDFVRHDDDLLAFSLSYLKQTRCSPRTPDDRPAVRAPAMLLTASLSHEHHHARGRSRLYPHTTDVCGMAPAEICAALPLFAHSTSRQRQPTAELQSSRRTRLRQ